MCARAHCVTLVWLHEVRARASKEGDSCVAGDHFSFHPITQSGRLYKGESPQIFFMSGHAIFDALAHCNYHYRDSRVF